MMYMGGFLGLVAMLSFEIGGWQSLDLSVKLGAIILVYLAFGALGLVVRRMSATARRGRRPISASLP